jgi:hypothetical protein
MVQILEFGFFFHSFSYKILIDPNSIFDFDGPSWNGKREPDAKTFHIFYSVRTDSFEHDVHCGCHS